MSPITVLLRISSFWRQAALAMALACLLQAAPAQAAAPGSPDTAFGAGGITTLGSATRFFASAVDASGRLVAVGEQGIGSPTLTVAVARLTAAGAPDGGFGSGGLTAGPGVASQGGSSSVARAVAVQSDGKIVVVGKATDSSGLGETGLLVERFNANGTLDTAFGSGGVVDLLGDATGDGYAVALQSDGKIVVGGSADLSAPDGSKPRVAVARLTSNGALDPSFGTSGIAQINLGAFSVVRSIAVQANGAIVIGGSQSPGSQATNALLARLTSAGALDTGFNTTGAVAHQYAQGTGAYSAINAVAIQPNGSIVAAGSDADGSGFDAFVARFTTTGQADPSFGTSGVAYQSSSQQGSGGQGGDPGANAVTIAGNGDIVTAGAIAIDPVQSQGAVWALTPTGSLDGGFGSNGRAILNPAGTASAELFGLAQAPSGSLSVVGDDQTSYGGTYAGLTARFIGLGPAPSPSPSPSPSPGPVRFSIAVGSVAGKQKISAVLKHGVGEKLSCNAACGYVVTLTASASVARQLKIGQTVRRCRKVHGKRRCTASHVYRALTLGKASGKLTKAGSRTVTVRIAGRYARALGKAHRVGVVLTTQATSGKTRRSHSAKITLTR